MKMFPLRPRRRKLGRILPAAGLGALVVLTASASGVSFGNSGAIIVNDGTAASTYPSTLAVSGLTGTVTKVVVKLNGITHAKVLDVDMLLVGPAGQNATIMSDVGNTTAISNVNLTLDDAAANSMPTNPTILTTGTYKPTNLGSDFDSFPSPAPIPSGFPVGNSLLSAFNATNPNGTWNLYIIDDGISGTGTMGGGWQLLVTTTGSPQTTFTNAASITINDRGASNPMGSSPYPSNIVVSGVPATISNMSVGLNGFSHTFPVDLDILLVGPGAQNAIIFSDVGGSTDATNLSFTLNDAAASSLPSPLVSGNFKPTNNIASDTFAPPAPAPSGGSALSVFNGTSANGTWALWVSDQDQNDGGYFAGGWSLTFNSTTAVAVTGLGASAQRGAIAISWRTTSEARIAGFNVYRGTTRINRQMIPAKRAGAAGGASYRVFDRSALPGSRTYRLEVVRIDGRRATAGFTTVAALR
jgi:subtilisin-like proprotein convertase family protein